MDRIRFECEDAKVVVVTMGAELLIEEEFGFEGVGVEVGLVEEAGVDADVGAEVEVDVVAVVG